MKNIEVQQLQKELNALADYCAENNVCNFNLNRILTRNDKIIRDCINDFFNCVPSDVKEIQRQIEEAGKLEAEILTKEDQVKIKDMIHFGLQFVSEEIKTEWLTKSAELLNEETDINLYLLEDISKIDRVDLPISYHYILEKFLKN